MASDPNEQGRLCRELGACDGHWHRIGDALVCQCARRRCRRIIAVTTAAAPPFGLHPRAIDALQNTSSPPATDWPGCFD